MLLNYRIGHFVLGSLCVGDLVRLCWSSVRVAGWSTGCIVCGWVWVVSVLQASACNTDTTQTQPHQISNTQRTENKMTDVVIQQHIRKLLMMDILMSETCWVHKKWNKIASDIKLVFYSSSDKMYRFLAQICKYFTISYVLGAKCDWIHMCCVLVSHVIRPC